MHEGLLLEVQRSLTGTWSVAEMVKVHTALVTDSDQPHSTHSNAGSTLNTHCDGHRSSSTKENARTAPVLTLRLEDFASDYNATTLRLVSFLNTHLDNLAVNFASGVDDDTQTDADNHRSSSSSKHHDHNGDSNVLSATALLDAVQIHNSKSPNFASRFPNHIMVRQSDVVNAQQHNVNASACMYICMRVQPGINRDLLSPPALSADTIPDGYTLERQNAINQSKAQRPNAKLLMQLKGNLEQQLLQLCKDAVSPIAASAFLPLPAAAAAAAATETHKPEIPAVFRRLQEARVALGYS